MVRCSLIKVPILYFTHCTSSFHFLAISHNNYTIVIFLKSEQRKKHCKLQMILLVFKLISTKILK